MEPITVMLVDDSPLFLDAATEFLKAQKEIAVVGTADSGQEALAKAPVLRPQVILIDMAMPGMMGLEAIPHLRRLLPDTGIIALTVMDTKSFREAALAAGADVFISKSVMRVSLLPAIREIAENRSKRPRPQASLAEPRSDETAVSRPVLLMEDDAYQCRLYAKVLRNAGYQVVEATTIQEARDLLARNHFSVFLCDIHMGDGSGTDLVREQRETLTRHGTRVVVISADPRYRAVCKEIGVSEYLEKPISLTTLTQVLSHLTGRQ